MRRTALLLAGIALLTGCQGEPTPTEATSQIQPPTAGSEESRTAEHKEDRESKDLKELLKNLATLRRVTAPFHSFTKAKAAGWSEKITSCMAGPEGGMGFHYGNVGLIDGTARVNEPELLLYEPERNGRKRLVAVEYIIPYTFHSRDAEAPRLFNQAFKKNDTFQLWGLHVWVWKHNPSGLFADWSPRVTCKFTDDVMAMLH
jgi:hypothetical protein